MTKEEEQLFDLIDGLQDVVPFLKTLNKKERKALTPTLQRLYKKYETWIVKEQRSKFGEIQKHGEYKYPHLCRFCD